MLRTPSTRVAAIEARQKTKAALKIEAEPDQEEIKLREYTKGEKDILSECDKKKCVYLMMIGKLIKVGMTRDLERRIYEHSLDAEKDGVSYDLLFAICTKDNDEVERDVKKKFAEYKVDRGGEKFKKSPKCTLAIVHAYILERAKFYNS